MGAEEGDCWGKEAGSELLKGKGAVRVSVGKGGEKGEGGDVVGVGVMGGKGANEEAGSGFGGGFAPEAGADVLELFGQFGLLELSIGQVI